MPSLVAGRPSLRRVMEDFEMENRAGGTTTNAEEGGGGGGRQTRDAETMAMVGDGGRSGGEDDGRELRPRQQRRPAKVQQQALGAAETKESHLQYDGAASASAAAAVGGDFDHSIHDPQALADYYLQHENIPRVILQADLLGRSAHAQIMRILPNKPPPAIPPLVSSTPEWRKLRRHAAEVVGPSHLREMLRDPGRCDAMVAAHDGVYYDYSRQRVTEETLDLLFDLAESRGLAGRIKGMFGGEKINFTEGRAVLHTALRAGRDEIGTVIVDGVDAIGEVHDVLGQIKRFTDAFRAGEITGYTGKRMRNIVSVGIGGSYLGPEFLHEVLKTESEGISTSLGYDLRFLANVDPVDVERTCADLDPEETLIIVVSKTFTTAETMLNARTMRQWLWDFMGDDADVVRRHVVACSSVSATENVRAFGIDTDEGMFRFWDWVGGRYSVCGAAGAVPISLMYGYDLFEKFLEVRIIFHSRVLSLVEFFSNAACLSSRKRTRPFSRVRVPWIGIFSTPRCARTSRS
jgi:hypothetical protein